MNRNTWMISKDYYHPIVDTPGATLVRLLLPVVYELTRQELDGRVRGTSPKDPPGSGNTLPGKPQGVQRRFIRMGKELLLEHPLDTLTKPGIQLSPRHIMLPKVVWTMPPCPMGLVVP